ncbi:MAG: hypothetical protein LBM19_00020 [Holosporales bacterium]|jgi:tetratricopeptide (TPR) repeat protein|nr:hypothetical protein [Holosporales bacterium]
MKIDLEVKKIKDDIKRERINNIKRFLFLLAYILSGLFFGGIGTRGASYQHDLDKAERHYEAGDYQKAAKHWEKAIAGDDKTLMDDIKRTAEELPDNIDDKYITDALPHLLERVQINCFPNLAALLFSTPPYSQKLFALYLMLDMYLNAVTPK